MKLLDLNKTVKHVSYREQRRRWERERRLSELFFNLVMYGTLIVFVVLAVISMMARYK